MSRDDYKQEITNAFAGWVPEDKSVKRTIPETRVLIAADAHLPYVDHDILALLREMIHQYRIQCVLWLGDLFDMHKFSSYGQTDFSLTWAKEKEICSSIIMQIARDLRPYNGYQIISKGNHDARWIKKLGNHEGMEGLITSISPDMGVLLRDGDIVTSDNPTVLGLLNAKGEPTWMFTHPAQFKQPFATPGILALHNQMHVLTGHAHHFGFTRDASNKFWVVEGGGLFDERLFEYVQHNPTTMRRMVSGFWIIQGPDTMPLGFSGFRKF